MGDVGGKLAAGLLGSGQVGRHVVEGDGELAQLAGCADPKSWPASRRRARGPLQRHGGLDAEELGCLAKRAWLP